MCLVMNVLYKLTLITKRSPGYKKRMISQKILSCVWSSSVSAFSAFFIGRERFITRSGGMNFPQHSEAGLGISIKVDV